MRKYLILSCSMLLLFAGCASSAKSRVFREGTEQTVGASAEKVWIASVSQLQGLPITRMNQDKRYFETSWIEGYKERPFGIFSGKSNQDIRKQRLKISITVDELDYGMSRLGIRAQIEEGVPEENGRFSWHTLPVSGDVEREFLGRILTSLSTA